VGPGDNAFDSARGAPDAGNVRRLAVCLVVVAAACQQGEPNLSSTEEKLVTTLPSSHDFGSLQVGQTSAPFTFTIAPSGTSSNDTVSSITESCPDFAVNAPGLPAQVYRTCDTCCPGGGMICPGGPVACCIGDTQSYDFDTTFMPTVAGTVSCTVTIVLNGGSSTKTVVLTGTGTPPPVNIVVTCDPGSGYSGDPYVQLNTSCFAPPQPGSDGAESARFFMRQPPINNLDASLSKVFAGPKSLKFEVRIDAFNVFNHTQFTGFNGTANFTSLSNPTITNLGSNTNFGGFGAVNGVAPPRTLQLVTRVTF